MGLCVNRSDFNKNIKKGLIPFSSWYNEMVAKEGIGPSHAPSIFADLVRRQGSCGDHMVVTL